MLSTEFLKYGINRGESRKMGSKTFFLIELMSLDNHQNIRNILNANIGLTNAMLNLLLLIYCFDYLYMATRLVSFTK